MDHGILNTSLKSRGDIDAQIDRYKADQAKAQRADRRARAAILSGERMTAKGLVANVSEQRVLELAVKCSVTPAEMRKRLKSDAHWEPAFVIRILTPAA